MQYQTPLKTRMYAIVACLMFLVFAYSCKKVYTEYPYHEIEKFVLTDNNGAEIKAVIQDDKIIVYYPPFQELPASVKPTITVSKNAKISPASGDQIPFKAGTTYTVTAQDGSVKKYTLQAIINQPPIIFTTIDVDQGETLSLVGQYFLTDTTNTKVYLIGKDNKEVQLPGSTFTKLTASVIQVQLPNSTVFETGTYHVKLVSGQRSSIQGPIAITPGRLDIVYPEITTIKRGQLYTIKDASPFKTMDKRFGDWIRQGVGIFINDKIFNVPLVKLTDDELTFRIPEDCPLGSFEYILINTKVEPIFLFNAPNAINVTQ